MTQAITLPRGVNHPQENTQRRPGFVATPTRRPTSNMHARTGAGGIRLCLHVFPEPTYCNKAPSSEDSPPPVQPEFKQRRMIQRAHTNRHGHSSRITGNKFKKETQILCLLNLRKSASALVALFISLCFQM